MRRSRAITLTVLAGLMLTACCITLPGCGRRSASAPDHTWYDANGNAIPEKWKTDQQGNRLLDEQGRPIPDPHVPYDRYHRPWVFTGGVWAPLPPPAGTTSSSSRTGSWLWGGSGYRSFGSGSGSWSSPSRSSSSPSSISRGGFGSTGSGSSS
jgi:hypothetical protein